MEFTFPKFPCNIKSYNAPIIGIGKLVINHSKCKGIQIFLRDDESRPFFKIVKLNENHTLVRFNNLCPADYLLHF